MMCERRGVNGNNAHVLDAETLVAERLDIGVYGGEGNDSREERSCYVSTTSVMDARAYEAAEMSETTAYNKSYMIKGRK